MGSNSMVRACLIGISLPDPAARVFLAKEGGEDLVIKGTGPGEIRWGYTTSVTPEVT